MSDIERFYRELMPRAGLDQMRYKPEKRWKAHSLRLFKKNNCDFRWKNIGHLSIKQTIWLTKWIHSNNENNNIIDSNIGYRKQAK